MPDGKTFNFNYAGKSSTVTIEQIVSDGEGQKLITYVHLLGGCNYFERSVSSRHMCINLAQASVDRLPDLPVPKFAHAVTICGTKIVMTSGVSSLQTNMGMRSVPIADRDCYTYDLGTKEYERLPDVPIGKFHPALITINNRFIFQIGGFDDHDYDIYQLDMHKPNEWVTLNLDRS